LIIIAYKIYSEIDNQLKELHKKQNQLILPNNQITVNDDMLGINSTLLIKSIHLESR
jgi:hypothetical protein